MHRKPASRVRNRAEQQGAVMVAAELQVPENGAGGNQPMTVTDFRAVAHRIEEEVGKVIVGQEEILRDVLISVVAGGHVLLEGVPGLGKTMLVRTLGDALELGFSRIQFTPDLM